MKHDKNSISNTVICSKIIDELCAIWEKTGIKTQRKDKVKQKLTNLYESYRTLTKHKGRNEEKSQLFLNQLEEFFYIAYQEAADIVQYDKLRNTKQKEDDLKFLDTLKDGKKSSRTTNTYSNIKVNNDNISVDRLTLFLSLSVIVEKKPEKEIEDYFYYELTSFPMSLFKDGLMRSAQKHKLKNYLTRRILPMPYAPNSFRIADGGALLYCCDWNKGEIFDNIFEKYIQFLNYFKVGVVVFDGYENSTKDTTRIKRGTITQYAVEIHKSNPCPSNKSKFFPNYANKKSFIRILEVKLRERVLNCVCLSFRYMMYFVCHSCI